MADMWCNYRTVFAIQMPGTEKSGFRFSKDVRHANVANLDGSKYSLHEKAYNLLSGLFCNYFG